MSVAYFKRFKMEVRLDETSLDLEPNAAGPIHFLPWSPRLVGRHAEVKYQSFRNELDAHVFPCLGEIDGCRQLMKEISTRKNFLPQATWLACRESEFAKGLQPCGTIQGLISSPREGAIQNLGVHPDCRDMGIGSGLLLRALKGFQEAGCKFANLEVTVQNAAAIRLYERFGFRCVETLFKVAEVQMA